VKSGAYSTKNWREDLARPIQEKAGGMKHAVKLMADAGQMVNPSKIRPKVRKLKSMGKY
jgi:hypothetical protein